MSEITYKIEWSLLLEGDEIEHSTDIFTKKNLKRLINFLNLWDDCITVTINADTTVDVFADHYMEFICSDEESAYTLTEKIHRLANKKDDAKKSTIALNNLYNSFEVKDILVNGPATIVFWKDGTKTVVKCGPEDMHDLEKAVAMCFMKKALGGRSMKKIFDLAEDRAAEYESQFTRLSLKEMGYCLRDALSTFLNQNPAKPCEDKIITDPDKIAEKMREERKEDKE